MPLFSTNPPLNSGAEAPVGTVISFMGTEAPPGYLACDGSQHSISDYPYLAQHFADDFGKSNYFGGDGTSTFAVPDLRGEFLRGTGTASRNTGSGAAVGTHQDATQHVSSIAGLNNALYAKSNGPDNWRTVLEDKIVRQNTKIYIGTSGYSDYNLTGASKTYTSRPTNTSILYCIKAKNGGTLANSTGPNYKNRIGSVGYNSSYTAIQDCFAVGFLSGSGNFTGAIVSVDNIAIAMLSTSGTNISEYIYGNCSVYTKLRKGEIIKVSPPSWSTGTISIQSNIGIYS